MTAFALFHRPLLALLALSLLAGCAAHTGAIADLERYPQDAARTLPASAAPLVAEVEQARLDARYNERFFAPWEQSRASLPAAQAFYGVESYGGRQGYAENLQPIGHEEWNRLVTGLQRESYPSLARPAITVRNSACRVFPTQRPFFLDPTKAGEGFPFDYFQNSALWTGTPLLITHTSADGAWYFAETAFVSGWVPAGDIAWVDSNFRNSYRTGRYAALLRDAVTLHDSNGAFLTRTHLGAVFPVAAQDDAGLQLLVPVRDADGQAVIKTTRVAPENAALKPLPLDPARIAELANHLLGQRYGWGGLFENRDCSATMRDLFTPFGIWLPRNSGDQAKAGTFDDFAGLSREEKRARIVRQGVPFYTLLWLKGHIGLYLGVEPQSDEPLLLHNLWGVRTTDWRGNEGRAVIGRLAITSLQPGAERSDVEDGRFLEKILGMTVLPGSPAQTAATSNP